MKIYTGEELKEHVAGFNPGQFQERDLMQEVDAYFSDLSNKRACALYGLRRTGKTVMLYQKMSKLADYAHSCYIACEQGDTIFDLRNAMRRHEKDCNYFFLDEVTFVDGFMEASAFLADTFTAAAKRVLMTGTDSLAFLMAESDTLLDRITMLHTSYIPYAEYHRLLGKSIDEYIEYGGTLTDGKTLYNSRNLTAYTNSAIVQNILHGLSHLAKKARLGALTDVYEAQEVETYINKTLEIHNHQFLVRVIAKAFKSHDAGSLRDILRQRYGKQYDALFQTDEFREQLMEALAIQPILQTIPNQKAVKQLEWYLEDLDLLLPVENLLVRKGDSMKLPEVVFTQPGMRYAQAEALIDTLELFGVEDAMPFELLQTCKDIVQNDIKGQLLEDIIYYHLKKYFETDSEIHIFKYKTSTYGDREFDIVLGNTKEKSAIVFEIKHSQKKVEAQKKHLANQAVCKEFETMTGLSIQGKAVIYRGKKSLEADGISYLNAEEFLIDIKKGINKITKHYQQTKKVVHNGPLCGR